MHRPAKGAGKIFAALMQSVGVQALGLVFFYLLSVHLSTEAFGLISWANAVSLMLVTIIGFGLEQVVLRRLAAGNATSGWIATAFMLHSLIGCALAAAILLLLKAMLGDQHPGVTLLPLLFAVQAAAMLVAPLKILLNAKARYLPYAVIALVANAGRIAAVVLYLKGGENLSVHAAAMIMLCFTIAELLITGLYVQQVGLAPPLAVPARGYRRLLQEAAPQYLSVLFDISLARADWILLGILSTDEATGQYTFAYRTFELLRIPTAAIGLLLMPRLAPLLQRSARLESAQTDWIERFYRIEMWTVCAAMLLMNVFWIPAFEPLTHGRYGAANAMDAYLLSICLPLHFSINLMWILTFAARKYASIARITLVSSIVNIGANFLLIPLLADLGAALAFLVASIVQVGYYYIVLGRYGLRFRISPLPVSTLIAAGCCALPWLLPGLSAIWLIVIPVAGFITLTALAKQWRTDDLSSIKQMLAR